MGVNRGDKVRYHASRKRIQENTPKNPSKIRPGMLVYCPLCDCGPVRVTRHGLEVHLEGDSNRPESSQCEASGCRVTLDELGNLVLKGG